MRAQIEQVGKTSAPPQGPLARQFNDIVSTISFVAAPAEFDKHTDLLPRYFGRLPGSNVSRPAIVRPDFLLEVEAVAAIK